METKVRRENTLVHALSNLVGCNIFQIESTLFSYFCVRKSLACFQSTGLVFTTSAFLPVLSPKNQMNAMVWHASGKHQACIILAIQPVEP